ncbi:MAG: helix-turn-helix domain-containing protein [bacterium]|jgi:hypothetical protein
MSSGILISDIAKAAGVADSTVSLVLNGKGDRVRISVDTQARIRNLASQMGYQPHQLARDIALGRGKPLRGISDVKLQMDDKVSDNRKIGLIFSAASPVESFALLPDQVSVFVAADYRVEIMKVSSEPRGASEQVLQFLAEGAVGVLCCTTIYTAVVEAVAGRVPVIVLWKGGAKSLLAKITGVDVSGVPAVTSPTPTPSPVPAQKPIVLTPPASGVVTPKPVTAPISMVAKAVPILVTAEAQVVVPERVVIESVPVPPPPPEPVPMPEVMMQPVPDIVMPEPPVLETIPVVPEVAPIPVITPKPVVVPEPVLIEPTPVPPPEPVPTMPDNVTPEPVSDSVPVAAEAAHENETEMPDDQNSSIASAAPS